ncbi:MAG: eukaryotic-like serine/threonine-protein kinase [Myxococcales bacterium]|nr:eukaryotic-like serine/threonine-protein kinase [Myxococcales bacterium]
MTERETPVTIGRLFADKYRVDGLLGNGGMGMVFAATHLQLETRVAIKLLHAELSSTETAKTRLLREARATAKIKSANVARVLDVGTVEWGGLFIVMEYLDGEDLAAFLQKQPRLSPAQAVGFLLQACDGVRAAHALGIIHRDLKPSNLFVTKDASGAVIIKVLDFGLSKLVDPSTGSPVVTRGGAQLTRPDSMIGSPAYMSPEQLKDPRAVDGRTDIWSLGVILFEMLSGARPFEAKTLPELCPLILSGQPRSLRELRPELPAELVAIVERCLQRDPAQRYRDVGALEKDLARFGPPGIGKSSDKMPDAVPAATPPGARHTKWRWIIGGGVGLLLAGIVAAIVSHLK